MPQRLPARLAENAAIIARPELTLRSLRSSALHKLSTAQAAHCYFDLKTVCFLLAPAPRAMRVRYQIKSQPIDEHF